jgi:2-polyprenyl-3-methyl-5-hydroxy-6-metoxy-1,4-benzoquinol methylase/glycosyltransferase involved in cell wall biosynthesis
VGRREAPLATIDAVNVCTIVAKNYLAHARLLALSLREQHPDSRLSVLVLDDVDGYVDVAEEPYRLLRPQDIDCEPFEQMSAAYSVIELSTAVKPWLLRKLLSEDDHAIYLDPDIQVLAPLDELRELALEHDIVLTPHNLTPIPRDGCYPSEESILIAGAYNLGFIALGPGEAARELLGWWSERLETDCVVDPGSGRFVDQKWIDLVPGIWPNTHLLRDPAYNIAYWNLHARELEHADGKTLIEGRPVRFLHFSGYDPRKPEELSKHQNRIRFDERPDVRIACDAYREALLAQGVEEASTWPYGLASLYEGGKGGRDGRGGPPSVEGVNVVGYLSAELGVGEVARQAIAALDASGVPVLPVGVQSGVSREGHAFDHAAEGAAAPFPINLVCVNADMLPTVAGDLGPGFFDERRTVGWWWWEVESFPERWHGAFDLVDEVWAGSRFVAEALTRVSPVPVVHVPTPVTMRPGVVPDRERLGLPDGFLFLFIFDFNSVMRRKNPLGVVEAYRRAFTDAGGEMKLILKAINGDQHPDAVAELRAAIGGREDVRLIDEYWDPADKDTLIASCDCYVSLHRSEGFGITLAEAMLLGKPVVGTAYSGSADYLSEDTGFPVRHQLVPIGEGAAPYPPDGRWAEPDLDDAAQQLRRVAEDPGEAMRRGLAGQAFVQREHSPAAAGAVMVKRLAALAPPQAEAGVAQLDPPAADIAQQAREATIGLVRREAQPARTRAGRLLGRVVNRLTRRSQLHQREVDEALWWCIESQWVATSAATTDLDRRARHLEALASAQALAEQRRSRQIAEMADAQAQTTAIAKANERSIVGLEEGVTNLHGQLAPLQDLRAAAVAEPYMDGTVFERFDAQAAGRVLGFRGSAGVANGNGGGTGNRALAEGDYHAFEDVFRGSEDLIRERQRRYLPLLRDHSPVVDAGCGRGELLDVLREEGIAARGVDLDPELVSYCRAKGHHDVQQGDAVAYLEALDEGSIGAVCSMQVVEHLPAETLDRMITAAHRALRPGGTLILETVNPHSPWAMKAFWVDLTHEQPIFPEVLLQLCRQARFSEAYAFVPTGEGDWDADRTRFGEYAVVARR